VCDKSFSFLQRRQVEVVVVLIAYYLLQGAIVAAQGPDSRLAVAIGRDLKGKISPLLYTAAIALAFVREWIADVLYVIVALMWLIPDPRIESRFHDSA
jgi:hypothetical protein